MVTTSSTIAARQFILEHARTLTAQAIPPDSLHAAGIFLHDSIAVGIAGARAPHADALTQAACGWGAVADQAVGCSVLGRPGLRLPAPQAAFVNAFQIHNQEFDCVHEAAVVHPMATLVAVLLAELDRGGPCDGTRLLTALVAGVDVAACLGLAATSALRFFRPATAGLFGCVAGLISLTGASEQVGRDAFGYALAFASGTMQPHVEGKPALPVQIANAAAAAIRAFDLARAGLPGPEDWLEGPFGYLPLFEASHDVSVFATLGRVFRISEVSSKPFPTGRAAHGAIVATQTLARERGVDAERLQTLTYRAPPLIARLVGRPAISGMQPSYARLCGPYLMAATLLRGTIGLGDFTLEALSDPICLDLASRIDVQADGNPDPAAFVPAQAIAVLRNGTTETLDVLAQFGSPAWPLTTEQHLQKAAVCLSYGGQAELQTALASLCGRLGDVPDVAQALRGLQNL